jgi:hypothetical protein
MTKAPDQMIYGADVWVCESQEISYAIVPFSGDVSSTLGRRVAFNRLRMASASAEVLYVVPRVFCGQRALFAW